MSEKLSELDQAKADLIKLLLNLDTVTVFYSGSGDEGAVDYIETDPFVQLEDGTEEAIRVFVDNWIDDIDYNGDGCQGSLTIDVNDSIFTVSHDTYYTTSENSNYKL